MKFFTWLRIQIESWIEYRRSVHNNLLVCDSCENLKMQNAYLQSTINKLLDDKLHPPIQVERTQAPEPITKPIGIPWTVQRHKLEQESRKQADELLRAKNEELEQELVRKEVKG